MRRKRTIKKDGRVRGVILTSEPVIINVSRNCTVLRARYVSPVNRAASLRPRMCGDCPRVDLEVLSPPSPTRLPRGRHENERLSEESHSATREIPLRESMQRFIVVADSRGWRL